MRCLLKVSLPVERGNQAVENGTLSATIEDILADLKPEAAYFVAEGGMRTGIIVVDLKDSSEIPAIAEPWFLAFDAHVEFQPAMNLEDLKKSASGMQRAVKKYGAARKRAA